MSIKEFAEKIKPLYTLFLIIVIATIFFALGRLSALEESKTPLRIINQDIGQNKALEGQNTANVIDSVVLESQSGDQNSGEVVASKSGSKYHFPWCSGAKSIKPENLITFSSIEEARKAGYEPAKNCKGLK